MHNAGNREVLDLVVKCEKAREGCEWEGEIRSLDQHKSTCLHVPVPCPRECDVGSVLRGDLQSHLRDYCSQRDYECRHCLQMGRYRERVTSHLQDCPMVPTTCPNAGCDEIIPSAFIPYHLDDDCPFTVLPCRYSEVGCKVQLQRRDLEEHEHDDRRHLQVVTKYSHDKITALQKKVDKLTTEIHKPGGASTFVQRDVRKLTTALALLQGDVKLLTTSNTFEVKRLTTANSSLQSDVKELKTANTSLQSEVDKLTSTNTSLQSEVDKLTTANTSLQDTVKVLTTVNACLQNDVDRLTTVTSSLHTEMNKLTIPLQKTFKVTEYQQKKEENATFYSPPFCGSSEGYHMKMKLEFGVGITKTIAVSVLMQSVSTDYSLKWPFVGEVTVMLLNQLRDDAHHTQTLVIKPEASFRAGEELSFPRFIRHSALGYRAHTVQLNTSSPPCQYLKDNTLYFRVWARTQDYTPWLDTI